MTLAELAAKSGVTTEKIASYTQAGLLPCKDEKTTYTDKDLYWLDMITCFVDNGSSLDEMRALMPICESVKQGG
ncbi:hypothetical protein AYR62_14555 [Secundilactobacillus paracollinoides]|uniref:HTH merR-type domain-containing protein n=1 Tax=Secundilactobacillus paracollinoides TaxID=240427 RepID=A0A1B2IX95_9LACO|nr:helix-turn-helix domain-containing protein [Secundilactobacillus paracollinoides]ANZ60805.1 hypothetical protein AYR61_05250 [Secundilactobacillus paracollinoides]ANZ65178.1 hypothetical protein AYR62_14555 [Secundilactobacillus paracollinoides]ANZ66650.1 hypothetical protein AYR63_05545 [Secundilactobacillus paracollinoides]